MGKQGKLNAVANKMLNLLWIKKDIMWCEVALPHNCNQFMGLTNAHRHKRDWYKGKRESLLWDYSQVIRACVNGHQMFEYNKELTERIFRELRGEELLLDKDLKKE